MVLIDDIKIIGNDGSEGRSRKTTHYWATNMHTAKVRVYPPSRPLIGVSSEDLNIKIPKSLGDHITAFQTVCIKVKLAAEAIITLGVKNTASDITGHGPFNKWSIEHGTRFGVGWIRKITTYGVRP